MRKWVAVAVREGVCTAYSSALLPRALLKLARREAAARLLDVGLRSAILDDASSNLLELCLPPHYLLEGEGKKREGRITSDERIE